MNLTLITVALVTTFVFFVSSITPISAGTIFIRTCPQTLIPLPRFAYRVKVSRVENCTFSFAAKSNETWMIGMKFAPHFRYPESSVILNGQIFKQRQDWFKTFSGNINLTLNIYDYARFDFVITPTVDRPVCLSNETVCGSGQYYRCISNEFNCDGIVNCPNASDERCPAKTVFRFHIAVTLILIVATIAIFIAVCVYQRRRMTLASPLMPVLSQPATFPATSYVGPQQPANFPYSNPYSLPTQQIPYPPAFSAPPSMPAPPNYQNPPPYNPSYVNPGFK